MKKSEAASPDTPVDARSDAQALIDVYIESARSRSTDRPHTMAVISFFPPTKVPRPLGQSPALRLLKASLAAASLYAAAAVMSGPAPHRAQLHSSPSDTFGLRDGAPLRPNSLLDRLSALEGTARALFLGRDRGAALTDRQRRMIAEAEGSAGETIVVFDTTDLANILTTARTLTAGEPLQDRLAGASTLLELSRQQPMGFTGAYGPVSREQPGALEQSDRLFVGLPLTADGITQEAEDLLLLHELGHAQTLRGAAGSTIRDIEVLADVYAALSFIRSDEAGVAGAGPNLQPLHDLRDLRALMVFDRNHDSVAALDEVLARYGNRTGASTLARLDNDAVMTQARAITGSDPVQAALAVHDGAEGGRQVMAALTNFHDNLEHGGMASIPEAVRYEQFSSADRRFARLLASQLRPALERTPELGRFLSNSPDATLRALTVIAAAGILPRDRHEALAIAELSTTDLTAMESDLDPEAFIRTLNRDDQPYEPGPEMR